MLLGIIATAAGVKKTVEHLSERLDPQAALLLGGGMAVYLAGEGLFRALLRIGAAGNRFAAAVCCVASVVLGVTMTALIQLLALVGVVVGMLLLDNRPVTATRDRRTREARWTGDRP
jgi:low temperature requirement protein LtrA